MTREEMEMSFDRSVIAAMIELASADRGDWDSTIQHILRVEANVLDVERVSFWTVREELGQGQTLVCEMAYHRANGVFERGSRLAVGEHQDYFQAILRSAPLAIEDVRSDPQVCSMRPYFEEREISSVLDFPVWSRGRIAGLLSLGQVGPARHWSTSDERFAAAVAQTASAALEARARAEAQESALRTAFLEQAARTLGQTLRVDEVARRAIALTVPSFADGLMIDLVDDGTIRRVGFDFRTTEGRALLEAAMEAELDALPKGPYIAQRVLARRDSLLLPDLTDDLFVDAELRTGHRQILAAFRAVGMRSMVAVPLFCGERIVGIATFVTASRHFAIEDLGHAEAFAPRLAAALENARLHERAQAAVRARDEFIALAGHELRTPLTALQLTAQELVRRAPDESVQRLASNVVKQLRRLDRLAQQMLDASRASTCGLPFSTSPTDLAAVARETAEAMEPVLRASGCTLDVRADAPVVGEWDAAQLDQMLSCLLDNAAKFGAGKPIEVTVARDGDAATLSVRDHGGGIPPERVASIFAAYERAVPARHYGGLGLGLFLAKAIVEGHGGRLTVDNHPGEGATFTARLPLSPSKSTGVVSSVQLPDPR
jgi:signal transduction histidine kinase